MAMKAAISLLVLAAAAAACSTLPIPGLSSVGSGVPQTCEERLSEPACKEGTRCRWINEFKRIDGTYATAHCSAE
jgi:hypothetical protein